MFKSSSKIEEGLDAIMEDGGIEENTQISQLNKTVAINTAEIELLAQASVAAKATEAASKLEAVNHVIIEKSEQAEKGGWMLRKLHNRRR